MSGIWMVHFTIWIPDTHTVRYSRVWFRWLLYSFVHPKNTKHLYQITEHHYSKICEVCFNYLFLTSNFIFDWKNIIPSKHFIFNGFAICQCLNKFSLICNLQPCLPFCHLQMGRIYQICSNFEWSKSVWLVNGREFMDPIF